MRTFAPALVAAALAACLPPGPATAAPGDWTLSKTASPATYTAAGQVIHYTYTITNVRGQDGHITIALTDDKGTVSGCGVGTPVPPAGITCTGTYTTTAADVTAGSITNHASVTGDSCNDGCVVVATAQATVTFVAQPSWTMSKTPNPPTYTAAGQTISYSYLLTNTGNVSISSIAIADNKIAGVSCPSTTLAAGANMVCVGNYTTTSADVSAGSVTNSATATGTPSGGTLPPATAQATITFVASPSWTLTKTPNPATYTAAGQAISYSYLLTNTGNVSISSIAIADNKIAGVSCPSTALAAGANMTCTGSYTTTAADVSAGSVTNSATATGTPSGGTLSPATAQATITFVANPSWTLTKTANPAIYTAAGQAIAYTYVLTNTGNTAISAIAISDDKVSPVSCPASSLAVGATLTCTGSYTTTAADVSTGSVVNTATATGTPARGTLAPVRAQFTISFAAHPAWTLAKSANPATFTAAGQTIAYSYVLTNTGNATISAIAISDDKVSPVTCPATTLAAGANITCTGSYKTTAADLSAGKVTNTATATGTPSSGTLPAAVAQATIGFAAQPSWTLAKSANPTTYTAAGQTITYSYVLTNTGNTPISTIAISDDKVAAVSCPVTTLAAGANMTCTGTYRTTNADVAAGSITNSATATGTPPSGPLAPVTARATITFNAQPSWTLTKTANPNTYSAAGQTITYSYVVTNTGNTAISAITVTDNKVRTVTCPFTSLAAGAAMTCGGTYTVVAADVSSGTLSNTATARGTPAGGTLAPITATLTLKATIAPVTTGSITIIAQATSDPTFNFVSTIAGATSFSLTTVNGTASRTFTGLPAGTYTVTEVSLPLHWTLSTITCVGDTGGRVTTVNVATLTATIGLDGGEAITCTFGNTFQLEQHIQQTQAIIQNFLSHRIQLLADDGPDRNRFLRRVPGSLWGDTGPDAGMSANAMPLSFSGSSGEMSSQMSFSTSLSQMMAYAKSKDQDPGPPIFGKARKPAAQYDATPGIDLWVEAHFNQYGANTSTLNTHGHFNIVYLGADYVFMRSVLVGVLAQFDWTGETLQTANSSIDGHGWMAGPYISARLAPNLFFDARGAWGTSSNNINPFGLYQDKFNTDRWLAEAKVTGNWWRGNFRITPSAGVTFVGEKQLSYTDSLGVLIPEQNVSLGRFAFGPEFGYRIFGANGVTYEPHVAIKGIWDFMRPDTVNIGGILVGTDAVRAMVQGGLLAHATNGYSIRLVGQYDGIGSSSFHSYGGQVWLNIPLH